MLNCCTGSRSHPPWREKKSKRHGVGSLEDDGRCQTNMAPGSKNQEMNVELEGGEKRYVRTGDEVCAN